MDKIQKFVDSKLYHQLTQSLLEYLVNPPFTSPSAAGELKEFYESFIRGFDSKFDKVRWVQILSIIAKPQTPQVALELLAPYEEAMASSRDAKFLWQTLKGEKLTLSGNTDAAKELLDTLGADIDAAYEVQALIQSHFHKTKALLWKTLSRPDEFYKSSILYLAFTPLEAIPKEERPRIAFETVVSALVAEEEFNFGELTQQEIIPSLEGSQYAWIRDLLQAFSEGKFDLFDSALAKNKAQMEATPELKSAEIILRRKMCALSLMELAFRKPKKQRRLNFTEVAQHCRVAANEVEHLVMKSMCADLIRGQIDEVNQLVTVTWVKPRILDPVRIDLMRERMDAWASQTGLLLEHLEQVTPELLVS